MLIDKYLCAYHFNEFHSIAITHIVSDVYQQMLSCDFTKSTVIKLLFRLRGIPANVNSIEHLNQLGFVKLDEIPGEEILFGMVTENGMFNSCNANFSAQAFSQLVSAGIIKAVINFKLQSVGENKHIISTETRVWCSDKSMMTKFSFYWFFIKPFSQLIRKSMLYEIKFHIRKLSIKIAVDEDAENNSRTSR